MKIEIDDNYLEWIKESNPELFAIVNGLPINNEMDILTNYINEVLISHKNSWDLGN